MRRRVYGMIIVVSVCLMTVVFPNRVRAYSETGVTSRAGITFTDTSTPDGPTDSSMVPPNGNEDHFPQTGEKLGLDIFALGVVLMGLGGYVWQNREKNQKK